MKYNTVLFDLDGTVVNSLGDLTNSVNKVCAAHSFPQRTIEEIRSFIGNGIPVLLKKSMPSYLSDKELSDIITEYRGVYSASMLDTTVPYDGVGELIDRLLENGFKIAVITNKRNSMAKAIVSHFFPQIEVIVGEMEDRGIKRKPAPDMIDYALSLLSSDRESAVYVGDSEVDILTAHNSSLKCLSVTWGYRSRGFLEKENYDFLFDSPEEIFDFLTE